MFELVARIAKVIGQFFFGGGGEGCGGKEFVGLWLVIKLVRLMR